MIKMYNAEVLSKFPVVQHFPFGSLFSWEQDPDAPPAPSTAHTVNQPYRSDSTEGPSTAQQQAQESTKAPWAIKTPNEKLASSKFPLTQASTRRTPTTTAPWAVPSASEGQERSLLSHGRSDVPTRAPWTRNLGGPPE